MLIAQGAPAAAATIGGERLSVFYRLQLALGLAFLIALPVASAFATSVAPLATTTPLALTISSSSVVPGQTIHVSATGLTGLPIAGQLGCLGILGPGQNVEQNLSPAFRSQIGTMAIALNGTGQSDAVIPAELVPGSYRLVFGGCSPQGTIAPLATIAQATIQVLEPMPQPAPTRSPVPNLPATGGVPTTVVEAVIGAGVLLLGIGLWLRRRAGGPIHPDGNSSSSDQGHRNR